MPSRRKNVRDDQFTYSIDVVDDDDIAIEHIAGANNIFVANRSFDQLLFYFTERSILMLREGGRVMRREHGTGGWHREYIARTIGLPE